MQQNNHNQGVTSSLVEVRFFLFALFFLSMIWSCSQKKKPDHILEEQKMMNIMIDLHIVDGYMSSLMYNDSTRIKGKNFYASVYDKHKVTRAEYEKSLKYYSMDPVLLDSMYSKVERILSTKEQKLNKEIMNKQNKPLK